MSFSLLKPIIAIRGAMSRAEGWWFDAIRQVKTEGYVPLAELTLAGTGQSGYDYQPVRPSVGRQALVRLPIQNFDEYTFVDLGSGKGRMLLVAAEFPFQKIRGIEFAIELHRQAEQNIARYRYNRQLCTDLESINVDALDYVFPDSKLILYFFNPFSPEVLRKILLNLQKSLAHRLRPVFIIMAYPQYVAPEQKAKGAKGKMESSASVADSMPFLRLFYDTTRIRVYQTVSR
jgi:hypothetical protein